MPERVPVESAVDEFDGHDKSCPSAIDPILRCRCAPSDAVKALLKPRADLSRPPFHSELTRPRNADDDREDGLDQPSVASRRPGRLLLRIPSHIVDAVEG